MLNLANSSQINQNQAKTYKILLLARFGKILIDFARISFLVDLARFGQILVCLAKFGLIFLNFSEISLASGKILLDLAKF